MFYFFLLTNSDQWMLSNPGDSTFFSELYVYETLEGFIKVSWTVIPLTNVYSSGFKRHSWVFYEEGAEYKLTEVTAEDWQEGWGSRSPLDSRDTLRSRETRQTGQTLTGDAHTDSKCHSMWIRDLRRRFAHKEGVRGANIPDGWPFNLDRLYSTFSILHSL